MASWVANALSLLKLEKPFVLVTILRQSGSAPRGAGTRMVVHPDGGITGTVGGGIVEARIIETAVTLMGSGQVLLQQFDLDNSLRDSLDMICGGKLEVLLESLPAQKELSPVLEAFEKSAAENASGILVTRIRETDPGQWTVDRGVIGAGEPVGDLSLPKALQTDLRSGSKQFRKPTLRQEGAVLYFIEPRQQRVKVVLFGAGHVSAEVARLAHSVDFLTIVCDDRTEFANRQRFPNVESIQVLTTFEQAFKKIEINADSYVVILTRGHDHDRTVLAQALQTTAGYIGMIGSKRKRKAIYAALQKKGVSRERLAQVHCPIGLEIGAQTPREIAFSIVAELIRERAAK